MESFPPELQYNNINPKGFFSTFKEWTIEPLASGGVFWPGENIKILIQSVIGGVMDPYRSHLEFEVEVDEKLLPVGLLQVDSSAQSFIEQLVVNSKNREIERIPEYSVLAAWLTDCGLSELYAEGRETEGLGYTNIDSLSPASKQGTQTSGFNVKGYEFNSQVSEPIIQTSLPTVFPTQNSNPTPYVSNYDSKSSIPKWRAGQMLKGHHIVSNPAWLTDNMEVQWEQTSTGKSKVSENSLVRTGYLKNLRAEYLESIQNLNYPDSTSSKPKSTIHLKPSVFNGSVSAQWDTGEQYLTEVPQNLEVDTYFNATSTPWKSHGALPNTTSIQGFSCLYSPNFCKGVHEPFISANIPQCQMKNGKILSEKIPITKRTFKVPLISAILGLLIPEDQFVLIPIKALNEVLLEFVIDRYAMFTSGFNDISEFDEVGMKLQQLRAFTVKRVFYKMHTYQFYNPQVDQYLNEALTDRILLNVNMWTLGNQYQVIKGENLNNTWPVACTSEALNEIVVLFVPLDYQIYSFCRKHFRISNNITKFQLRINMDYYPSQPILGNGGNPQMIDGQDNSAFVEQIFWSNNFMFNKVNPWPRINAYNFAVNDRCYDPTRTETFYDPQMMVKNGMYIWNSKSVNQDTALGMPWIHENRYVGKAGYIFGFEPYAHSAYHLTGMDCRQVRQFDVLLNTNPIDNFQREQTMYIFTRSSVIVEYTNNGINVYGR